MEEAGPAEQGDTDAVMNLTGQFPPCTVDEPAPPELAPLMLEGRFWTKTTGGSFPSSWSRRGCREACA